MESFYKPRFVMRCKNQEVHHPVSDKICGFTDIWTFRSSKSNKRYIVEIEGFDKEFYGIKFYWKGVEKSPDRYSLLTNDYEPRTIIRSCIEVMLDYYRRNPLASFGFVAAPDLEKDIKRKHAQGRNRRFDFYQRLMISLFGPETFCQVADTTKTIYLMINTRQLDSGTVTIQHIEDMLNRTYCGDYSIIM